MIYYFLESILKELSKGKYKENFIFKGGFILSNVVGINARSTTDIDLLYKDSKFSDEKILEILDDSLSKKSDDALTYIIKNIENIKEDNQYGGFRVKILCKLENIEQIVHLDIAIGDIVTPGPIDYNFSSIFGHDKIEINAYPIETMIAEKLQTIYKRNFLNSRSKDYYDLHILYKLKLKEIDFMNLKNACERTFTYRNTEFDIVKIKELLEKLKVDETFLNRWKIYAKKNPYVGETSFEKVIDDSLSIVNKISLL